MKTNMILSASGWRKVFAISGAEQDKTAMIGEDNIAISIYAAKVFADYIKERSKKMSPRVVLGMDSRPTGQAIAEAAVKCFASQGIDTEFLGITAAPEIMAHARKADGFMYISASHNPVGHNGIKFGLNGGGVLNGAENALLVEKFNALCAEDDAQQKAFELIRTVPEEKIAAVYKNAARNKQNALASYHDFLLNSITAKETREEQEHIFSLIKEGVKKRGIGVVCDMNGSARALSVDKDFFAENGISFYAINDTAGRIVHEIIPESENLVHVAAEMERLQAQGKTDAILGYMPDCDGDRGNIVYWDENQKKAVILKAQEVFNLSVLSELTYQLWSGAKNPAVAVNCPTSMRIEETAKELGAKVFRGEVGEANIVNLAAEKRAEGFDVRIFGEGSNGGTITHPSAVRDPLNTIFAIIKLLSIKDQLKLWCEKRGAALREEPSITDILSTLPAYTTTGVSEPRAVLHIETTDHAVLKGKFQAIFEAEWNKKRDELQKYGIERWEAVITNGTKETRGVTDFSQSKKGGLKILFKGKDDTPLAFIWMRGSGTEPVFRIMCDVKGTNAELERNLLAWETELLLKSDKA